MHGGGQLRLHCVDRACTGVASASCSDEAMFEAVEGTRHELAIDELWVDWYGSESGSGAWK